MNKSALPKLPCGCATLRRAARALTQLYEEALRPFGLRSTQFTILQALSFTGEITQGELGRILAMDSTTLTRTLEIMRRQGWITKRRGKDKREWRLQLAVNGKAQLHSRSSGLAEHTGSRETTDGGRTLGTADEVSQ